MPSAKVLVVDDDPDIIEVLRIILESADYEVSEAFGPREAHAQVAAGPDLILLDVMMPRECEGLTFLHQLRSEYPEAIAQTPVIILSAVYDRPDRRVAACLPDQPERVAEELPVQAFMLKPPEPAMLLATVASVLAQRPISPRLTSR